MSEEVEIRALIAAYDAGFSASAEGWNGEYGASMDSADYVRLRAEAIAAISQQPSAVDGVETRFIDGMGWVVACRDAIAYVTYAIAGVRGEAPQHAAGAPKPEDQP